MNRLLAVVSLAIAATLGWLYWEYRGAAVAGLQGLDQIDIPRGTSGSQVAHLLVQNGVGVRPWLFRLALRWRGDGHRIRAGSYPLEPGLSLSELLDRLTRGDPRMRDFVLVEGMNWPQLRQRLAAHPEIRQDTAALSDIQILRRLGVRHSHPEGLFAPDTYAFVTGTPDLDILRRAYRLQQERLARVWSQADRAQLPLASDYELLILASIIEKETGLPEDRHRVAAVFINRLNRGMMLQSDPTTLYGLGDSFEGRLRRRDLMTDTPYNTYTRWGLTPTPIAMPGLAALEAAISPAPISALFFVARGDGSSEFSDDLAAHNRAVDRYIRRKIP